MSAEREWKRGDCAWWQVRDPVLTAVEPQRLAVKVLAVMPKRVRVEVVGLGMRDPMRLPGERFTVTARKLSERAR